MPKHMPYNQNSPTTLHSDNYKEVAQYAPHWLSTGSTNYLFTNKEV